VVEQVRSNVVRTYNTTTTTKLPSKRERSNNRSKSLRRNFDYGIGYIHNDMGVCQTEKEFKVQFMYKE